MKINNQKIGYGKTILRIDIAKLHTRTSLDFPVIIQRAKKKGPCILLISGIHGDEVNGVEIVRQVISRKYNKCKAGTIICIPIVNVFGFLNQERDFPDGRDLNRMFPGSKAGSLASRFANFISQEILPQVDYIIDYHTGGASRFNYTQIRVNEANSETLDLAKVFGTKFILNANDRGKTLRDTATKLGKKVLLFEGGKSLDLNREVTEEGIIGTLKVLHHLGMADYSNEIALSQTNPSYLINKSSWIRAKHSGMYRSSVKLGSYVQKGQQIGYISDPYGDFERQVKAPNAGFIICLNHSPLVNQGDALVHITKEYKELD